MCEETRMTSCNLMSKIFLAFAVALFYNLAAVKSNEAEVATISFFICAAGDSPFNGEYLLSKAKVDGAPVYSNHNDMSFFRNRGFWYLGNLSNWPPQTHYRCVEMESCNLNLGVPPTSTEGKWSASKIGILPIPIISKEQCEHISVEEVIAVEINEL